MTNDRLQHAVDWCAKRKAEREAAEIARENLKGSNSFSGRAGMSRKMASSRQ